MSNNNSNPAVPGMMYPVSKGMLAGNPRASAMMQMDINNSKLASLNSAVGGRRPRRKSVRRGGAVVVPQFPNTYPQQSSDSTGTNAQIAGLSRTSTQASANKVYDGYATQKGGKCKSKKGGNPDWLWGCYSGGRRCKTTNRKHKRSRKHKSIKNRK
jgi:hypothetical protein